MALFHVISVLVTMTALSVYVNHRYLRLHPSIGVMLISLLCSLGLIALGHLGMDVREEAEQCLRHIPFGRALLQWMLGFLLFAGALTVDLNELVRHRLLTALLSTGATIASMFIVGLLAWPALKFLGLPTPLPTCILLGALISPTDPVAVVAVMRRSGAPRAIETIVAAESLFNDGVGVVLFLALLGSIQSGSPVALANVTLMVIWQSLGGAAIGLACGAAAYHLLRQARNFQVEVLLTLALVMGTYSAADLVHVSGPIAVVVAGLLIGNHGRYFHLAEKVNEDLAHFWELADETLNAILFVLIGLEVLVMPYTLPYLTASLLCIPLVLAARWASVTGAVTILSWRQSLPRGVIPILTWGGLRGGLAVAMALSIPAGVARDRIVAITYGVVAFSILVQGMTIRKVVEKYFPSPGPSR